MQQIPPLTKQKFLESQFMKYGFLPFVYLIEQFEKEENFEDCQLIYDIVKEKAAKFEVKLPTRFDKEAIDLFLNAFEHSPTKGFIALKNIPYYAEEIRCSMAGF